MRNLVKIKLRMRAMLVMLVVVISATLLPTIESVYCPPPPPLCGSCGGHQPPKGKPGSGSGGHKPPSPSPHPYPPKGKPPKATPPGSGGSPGGNPPVVIPPVVKPTPPSGGYPPYTPSPPSGGGSPGTPGTPGSSSPPSSNKCPKDALKIGACVDLLGGLLNIGVGDPVVNQCCPVLQGLLDLDAALCLCSTIRAKLLNLNIFLPLALQLLATCGKNPPSGFTCPPST